MSQMEQITDAKGRVLVLRKLGALDQAKIFRAAGAEQSNNQPYMNMVQAAAAVMSVDGTPLVMPTNERLIDAAIERLGDEGIAAVMMHQFKAMKAMMDAAQAAAEAGEAAPSPLAPPAPSPSSVPS